VKKDNKLINEIFIYNENTKNNIKDKTPDFILKMPDESKSENEIENYDKIITLYSDNILKIHNNSKVKNYYVKSELESTTSNSTKNPIYIIYNRTNNKAAAWDKLKLENAKVVKNKLINDERRLLLAFMFLNNKQNKKGGSYGYGYEHRIYGYPYHKFETNNSESIFTIEESKKIKFLKTKMNLLNSISYKINLLDMIRNQYSSKLSFEENVKNKQFHKNLNIAEYNVKKLFISTLHGKTFDRLDYDKDKDQDKYLDDELINIVFQSFLQKKTNTEIFTTHFYTSAISRKETNLNGGGFKSFFDENRIMYIPINIESHHWFLSVIDLKKKKIIFYDSIKKDDTFYETYFKELLNQILNVCKYDQNLIIDELVKKKVEFKDKLIKHKIENISNKNKESKLTDVKKMGDLEIKNLFYDNLIQEIKNGKWKMKTKPSPVQKNGFDCGVHVITNVVLLMNDIELKKDTYGENDTKMIRAYLFDEISSLVTKKKN